MSQAPRASRVRMRAIDEAPATALEFLAQRFPHINLETWRQRMQSGMVRQGNGSVLNEDSPFRSGEWLLYFREVAEETSVPLRERVIYRDARLVVADKPAFLPVTPGGRFVNECLLYRLRRRLDLESLTPLHRLDRHTQGLVLFATSSQDAGHYGRLFAQRSISKEYLAVARVLREPVWRKALLRHRIEGGVPWFRQTVVAGLPNAQTEVQILERDSSLERGPLALLKLRPISGRKHQLRVQLSAVGLPLLNDPYYPELRPETSADPRDAPLALLAHRLSFLDPHTSEKRSFTSSLRLPWRNDQAQPQD